MSAAPAGIASHSSDARQLLHLASGIAAVTLKFWPAWLIIAALCAAAVATSLIFCFGGRHRLLRPEERHISGATWYAVGVIIAVSVFAPEAAFVGWLVLAVGDSASTIVGTRLPLRKYFDGRRSLGGAVAFAAASAAALFVGLGWWTGFGALTATHIAAIAVVSVVCAAAEVIITRVDDNLYLPSLAAAVYTMMLRAL